jgi:K+-transporting ATPase KdpF subunit
MRSARVPRNLLLAVVSPPTIGAIQYGSHVLDSGFGFDRCGGVGIDVRVRRHVRPHLKGNAVFLTLLAAVVTLLLLVYLLTALLRPEWF